MHDFRKCALLLFVLAIAPAQAQTQPPEEFLAKRDTNITQLPKGWSTTRPIQLAIAFTLKSAPNSVEANAFLKTLHASMTALPEKMDFKLYRQVTPNRFQYTVTMTFPNWDVYMAHEKSEAFLKYYREHWKPAVTDAEERLAVVDDETVR
ncbi:MAG: hypothetical protein FJX59_07295 [Alphaproteobacteria bacterium]|nr:hypothetical protein [Alphaproteobacteria bacterium]